MAAGLAEGQAGDAGAAVGEDGAGDGGEMAGSGDRVVAESFEAQQAPGGGEADLDLPRAFRTAYLWLIHAADCRSRYSSWTCRGVRY